MQEAYIAIGTKFLLNGRAFQIVESPEKDIFLCEDLGFKHVKERFTRENILFHWQYGNLQFDVKGKNTKGEIIKSYEVNDIDALKEEEKKRAYFRYECIEPLIELEAKSLDKYIRARVDQLKEKHHHDAPSRASLYRWLKYYKDSAGDLRSLVSNYNACGPTTSTLEEEVYHIIVEKINMFTKREKYTARDIHDFVIVEVNNRNMSRDEKLKLPCEQTVRRFIKRLDGYEMEKQRNGVQKARAKHKQTNLQEKPTFPLQRVEIDHTKSD
ncbi:transposase, partial [Paenibacillus alginolyticus]|nr:transposase [Paenibacillus alginolyticus]